MKNTLEPPLVVLEYDIDKMLLAAVLKEVFMAF
jgi:hypothetical protein